ncbi:hypothetical protein DBR07_13390 [Aeromonas sp. HMWF036]|uniref:hypothetical protein n=1 Tax=unclassified Aeromonas TaxID=257493 RepID=UPI000D360D5D|nr:MULTISPECIES: hypothetical protein [unclassified Aeromonas]PTS76048.1 hypothetical protein DBR07_13390 [Aeromonas sp. HMWF036]PTT31632.1 hypothetical protein DBR30_02890 [Aeromonas sp. HMWF017]
MPYVREHAGKGGHADFVRNPDVQNFLSNCDYLREPSDEEGRVLASRFQRAPRAVPPKLPKFVVASDASKNDTPINDKLPSTQIGFLKVSHVLVNMENYAGLLDSSSHFIDPFKIADMHRSASPITFTMPGSNIRYKGVASVKHGFRRALFDQMSVNRGDGQTPMLLTETLRELVEPSLKIMSCPSCGHSHCFDFIDRDLKQCPVCHEDVFITDWLRLHEGISDYGDNSSAMTRMMNAVEHLMLGAYILQVFHVHPGALSDIAFVLDGPLALFGEPAKLSFRLQALIHKVNVRLAELNLSSMLVVGLQKTGVLMDHALLLERFLDDGMLRLVDDDYRNTYITGSDSPASNFGNETYYGQDFLFKTERGRMFNFALPYPFPDKNHNGGGRAFALAKSEIERYGDQVQRACDLIRYFEMDLYDNAIVPVALAHRHASISLVPGGQVLNLLVRGGVGRG